MHTNWHGFPAKLVTSMRRTYLFCCIHSTSRASLDALLIRVINLQVILLLHFSIINSIGQCHIKFLELWFSPTMFWWLYLECNVETVITGVSWYHSISMFYSPVVTAPKRCRILEPADVIESLMLESRVNYCSSVIMGGTLLMRNDTKSRQEGLHNLSKKRSVQLFLGNHPQCSLHGFRWYALERSGKHETSPRVVLLSTNSEVTTYTKEWILPPLEFFVLSM